MDAGSPAGVAGGEPGMEPEKSVVTTSTKPVRVLYCESNTDGTVGGSHYCLLYLIRHLDRTRFRPTVLFYDHHAIVPQFEAEAETFVHEKDTPVQWGTGSTGLLSLPLTAARRAVNLAKNRLKIRRHVAFLEQHGIQLVHLNNSITRHHDWMTAAAMRGIPCVVHERGLPRYGRADIAMGRRLAAIIPMSKWIARAMVEQGVDPANIRVMYDGLDPAGFVPRRSPEELRREFDVRPDQPVVGIVGNIRHWKGQETVARALVEVVKAHPDVVCFFVGATTPGDVPYKDGIERIIADAGIGANVRFTGYQSDVASFVNTMRFLIHASVEPEPFGMVVLEGMAAHKAVIGSRAGGPVEMVLEGETGYTFPLGDAATLAARMTELLSDPARAERMGQRGYERLVSDFSVQRYMHDIHGTYDAVLAGRPLPAGVPLTADGQP